ncbi:MAG: EAL domain-containing response regulator [Burkholderiales bacterium]|jgi:EAL domain-containing protein (putative c-di-GMP-specific phosphodiesterase class I)/CheY-like chemotaxis protein|nr:EAL domain-containing response regulator [Burkholderiales bacterium]
MLPPASSSVAVASLLVVDDNIVQRIQVVALCRELGIDMIYEAGSGAEALELLSLLVLPPDVAIVDLEMPGMDGIELIERLHERKLAIPLIVVSGREAVLIDTVETMARNLGIPVMAGIRKPLRRESLAAALEGWDRERAGPATAAADRAALPPIDPGELAAAIASGEIAVHYQPKVDMARGDVCGVEALARWTHPRLGPIGPDRFIQVAEEQGLIHALTMAVLRQAFGDAARWRAGGLHLSLAVNLSPRLLDDPSIVRELSQLLEEHGLDARRVVLEITENSLVDCMGVALGVLARLRLKGFRLSIDDYGTGFSSMQQLARIPFTELKIDRAFVHGAAQRTNLRVILQSALDMSRQLGLVTVAEGIETLPDWQLVRDSGCGIGQGFLVAKAMPVDELPRWIEAHEARLRELGTSE